MQVRTGSRWRVLRVMQRGAVVVVIGCGAPPTATPRPVPIDAAVDAPPDDPAMAEVLRWLDSQHDAMCACTDAACADETEALGFQWSFDHKPVIDAAKPTPSQDAAARAVIEATEACSERWHHLAP